MKFVNGLFSLLLVSVLACGGSGQDDQPAPPADYTISILGPQNDVASVGESIGLVLQLPETNVTQINWQQTAGPNLSFLGANRKVIGFDVLEAGSYQFSVNFRDSANGARNAEYAFSVVDNGPIYVNARLDHEANSQAKMSLHAYENLPGTLSSISWIQTSGPSATLDTTDKLSIYFTAPAVTQDTLMTFDVSVNDDQGNQARDSVKILLEPESIAADSHFNSGRFADISLADVYPYNANSPYADALNECIYSNTTNSFCNLSKLPFIGSQNANPSVDEIMDRVLVSHDWMGARFRDFLTNVDVSNDIKKLLGATTSIVISYDIKPSFFWSGTGAIYIDGNYFYVTPEERDTLNTTPDFRSDFDKDLQFRDPWRVTKDNDYAYYNPNRSLRQIRTIEDSQYFVMRVLYHELAHANDYFPPRAWASASGNDFTYTYSNNNSPDSDGLASLFPLASSDMVSLGDVLFQGNTATQVQMDLTPQDVSNLFFPDDATNTYNYSTEREDYAMLAEEYLMGYRFGVRYDQGITGLAPDYIISTAERGRVGHARILPRAEYVVSRILPSIDIQAASASFPSPVNLTTGISWWDALVVPTATAKVNQKTSPKKTLKQAILFGKDVH